MGAALAIAANDLRLLFRDKSAAFFVFIFPLMFALFFGSIFGGSGGEKAKMTIAVFNEDGGKAAGAFVESLTADGSFEVVGVTSEAAGTDLVRTSKAVAFVTLPKGFQDASDNMFAGKKIPVHAVMDPARKAESGLITGKLTELSFKQMSGMFGGGGSWRDMVGKARASITKNSEGIPEDRRRVLESFVGNLDTFFEGMEKTEDMAEPAGAEKKGFEWNPIDVSVEDLPNENKAPHNAYEISFPQGVLWGLMGCVTGFGISLAQERTRGTLVRLTTAPVSRGMILFGKALACFSACLMVQVFMLGLGILVFGIHIASWPMMGLSILSSSIGFAGLMMVIAGISQSSGGAEGAGRAILLILTMIGGGTVPLFLLPAWMQTASSVSPFKWALISIEGGLWRNFTLQEMALPCGVLLGCGVVGWIVGSRAFKWAT